MEVSSALQSQQPFQVQLRQLSRTHENFHTKPRLLPASYQTRPTVLIQKPNRHQSWFLPIFSGDVQAGSFSLLGEATTTRIMTRRFGSSGSCPWRRIQSSFVSSQYARSFIIRTNRSFFACRVFSNFSSRSFIMFTAELFKLPNAFAQLAQLRPPSSFVCVA